MSNPLSPRATGTDVRARVAADDENMHDVLHAALCAVQRSETTKHESCSVVASATHMNILPTQPPSTHQMDSGQGGSRPADGRPPQATARETPWLSESSVPNTTTTGVANLKTRAELRAELETAIASNPLSHRPLDPRLAHQNAQDNK